MILSKVAGGASFVQRSLAAAQPSTVSTTVLVDLHGYDGWPALAVLQDLVGWGFGFRNLDGNWIWDLGNWMDPFIHIEE